jgi:hypothetical protein
MIMGFLLVGRRSQNKNAAGVLRPAAIGLVKKFYRSRKCAPTGLNQ